MAVAQKNTQNGISMMQTAEGAFTELTNVLLRMKDLATEAFTASTTASDKTALQAEYDALGEELANIVKSTSFGGQTLFSSGTTVDGTGGLLSAAITFQIGASAGETMAVNTAASLTAITNATGLAGVSTHYAAAVPAAAGAELTGGTNAILTTIDTSLTRVGTMRAQLGAASNRLEHVYNNLGNMRTNTVASRGRIMDVDYAAKTSNSTSKQLLMRGQRGADLQSVAPADHYRRRCAGAALQQSQPGVLEPARLGFATAPGDSRPGQYSVVADRGAQPADRADAGHRCDLAFSSNPATPGDSGNLLALIALKTQPVTLPALGAVSLSDAVAQLVGKLGMESQQNTAALTAAETVRNQAEANWKSTSGVNMDEEGANLMQYQQMYQANMKVIAVANELFSSTLAMLG